MMKIRYLNLPHTIKGLTVQDSEGFYNIYLNARLTREANTYTLKHELKHIDRRDFDKLKHVSELER